MLVNVYKFPYSFQNSFFNNSDFLIKILLYPRFGLTVFDVSLTTGVGETHIAVHISKGDF